MHSQGERLRGSRKVKMTQKAPVSICASAQLRSGEVGASPQFRLVLSAVAAGEWRGAASPGLPLGPGWGCLPGSAPGSRRGLAFPWVCPWVRDGARVSLGLPLGPGWATSPGLPLGLGEGSHFSGSAPGSRLGLAFPRVCSWVRDGPAGCVLGLRGNVSLEAPCLLPGLHSGPSGSRTLWPGSAVYAVSSLAGALVLVPCSVISRS